MADKQTALAQALEKEIRALVKKYAGHEHLSVFTDELENVAEEIAASLEDTEDVE